MIDEEHLEKLGSTRVETVADLRRLARAYTGEALRTLIAIMMDNTAKDQLRLSAADSLLDRGWGKPPTSVSITADTPTTSKDEAEAKQEFIRRLSEFSKASNPEQLSDPDQRPSAHKDH